MAKLTVSGPAVVVEMSPWEQLGSLRRSMQQPVSAVTGVERVDIARHRVKGLRLPGTGVPGRILLGTFVKGKAKGGKQFAAAYRNEPGYVVTFSGCNYTQFIVSMDPSDDIEALME